MSTPSANTRSKTPTPSEGTPSTIPSKTHESILATDFSTTVASQMSKEADPTYALILRRELLAVLENPKAHKDEAIRKEFCRKFHQYTKAGSLDPNDILFEIAKNIFGMKQFKLVLVGGGGVGKTSFVTKHVDNLFIHKYKPTSGAKVTPVVFLTDQYDLICFNVWDTAGVEKHGTLRDGHYIGSHGAVLMYDVTSKASYKALSSLHKDLTRVCPDVAIICVGNKAEIKVTDRKVKPNQAAFPRQKGLRHFLVSNKSGLNFEQPILYLARKLAGDNRLRFVTLLGNLSSKHQSGDESDVLTATSQLSIEDRPLSKQAEVVKAAALILPPSKDNDGGL